jgi:hypothetical protein
MVHVKFVEPFVWLFFTGGSHMRIVLPREMRGDG